MAKRRGKKGRWKWVLAGAVLAVLTWALYGATLLGPEVNVSLETDRPAIGPGTEVTARFETPRWGLGRVQLILEQGDCREVLAEKVFSRPSPFSFKAEPAEASAQLRATVGKGHPACLKEGQATLTARTDRISGPLRSEAWSETRQELRVLFRPPVVQILSGQHYVKQGGSGIVAFHVSDTAVRSGVRAGDRTELSFPRPGGSPGDRICLFGIPWDLGDGGKVKVFAEDAAGNRSEASFIFGRQFKKSPPRRDVINLPESFLERVVPAIESQTPELDSSGSLIDRYLRINRDLRAANRAKVAEACAGSEAAVFWSGRFLQLKNSARRAGFAEARTYRYQGKVVDHQTHLGFDLASVAHAKVPAPNSGKVIFAGYLGIYGNVVILDHGYGLCSLCAHLSRIDVSEGQSVTKGDLIGRTGATGLAGGDHLHLGIFIQGVAVDPMEWLDEHWIDTRILPVLTGGGD